MRQADHTGLLAFFPGRRSSYRFVRFQGQGQALRQEFIITFFGDFGSVTVENFLDEVGPCACVLVNFNLFLLNRQGPQGR